MPEEIKSALDAVNAGIDSLNPPTEADAEPVETEEIEAPPAEESTETTAEQPAAESETPAEEAAREPAAEAAKDPEKAKPADPINDPIPAQVSERTRARITTLVANVKARDAEITKRDEVIKEQAELVQAIQETNSTPEEFGAMLQYMKLINSDNLEDKRAAFGVMVKELQHLANELGETVPGTNPLQAHPDLVQAVQAGKITPEHAQELAAARLRTQAHNQHTERKTATQQAQAEAESAVTAARGKLNTIGQYLSEKDPNYAAKYAVIVPMLRPVLAKLPPAQWEAAFLDAYKNLALPNAAATTIVAPKPQNQPLRANKQPSGSSSKAPTSMAEAIGFGLDSAMRK